MKFWMLSLIIGWASLSAADSGTDLQCSKVQFLQHSDVQNGDRLGSSLVHLDYNDDGHLDLAVGAPGDDAETGSVFVYFGPRYDAVEKVVLPNRKSGDRFGETLVNGGDLLSGGGEELLVGAVGRSVGNVSAAGQVFIVSRGKPLIPIEATDPQMDAAFGTGIAVGDFDGDDESEIAIGSPRAAFELSHLSSGVVEIFKPNPMKSILVLGNPNQAGDSFNAQFGGNLAVLQNTSRRTVGLAVSAMGDSVNGSVSHADGGRVVFFHAPISSGAIPTSVINPDLDAEVANRGRGSETGRSIATAPGKAAIASPRAEVGWMDPSGTERYVEDAGHVFEVIGPQYQQFSERMRQRTDIAREDQSSLKKSIQFGYRVQYSDDARLHVCSLGPAGGISIYDSDEGGASAKFLPRRKEWSTHFCGDLAIQGSRLFLGDAHWDADPTDTEKQAGRVVICDLSK